MASFEWDEDKNQDNIEKHGISFHDAQQAFSDPKRIIVIDLVHTTDAETRYFCYGKVNNKVCTIRFTYRYRTIRIFGAGYWRKERKIYEEKI